MVGCPLGLHQAISLLRGEPFDEPANGWPHLVERENFQGGVVGIEDDI